MGQRIGAVPGFAPGLATPGGRKRAAEVAFAHHSAQLRPLLEDANFRQVLNVSYRFLRAKRAEQGQREVGIRKCCR